MADGQDANVRSGPLSLSADEMRDLGYRVVDLIVDHAEDLWDGPAVRVASRADLERLLREPIPESGTDPAVLLDRLHTDILDHSARVDHPRFFAFIPSPGNFVGAMADALASGFNVFAGTWLGSSGASMLEVVVIDWLRQLCGMPDTAGGLFTSGGSAANMTALAVARHVQLDDRVDGAVIYASDQTHSSVERAARLLGFASTAFRTLPTDDSLRLDVDALRKAVAEDRTTGRVPFCVVANAGTTSTGAVDPLETLADLCAEEKLWLHVDGAYGAAAVLVEEGRSALSGMERADSLTLDPHKWFFQPFEIGCLLVRNRRRLADTFSVRPDYLGDTERAEVAEINFAEHGMQLTRGFRALKLWLSLKTFGLDAFREAVQHGLDLARLAEETLRRNPEWDIVTPAQMGIVSFRFAPDDVSPARLEAVNRRLVELLREDGFAMLSSTVLHGRYVLRMCTINPRTTDTDVRDTVERLVHLARAADTPV